MEPGPAGRDGSGPAGAARRSAGWQPVIPSVREHLPSVVLGAALPIGVYFVVRSHVHTDAQALIIAGCFSVAWIVFQFVRQRRSTWSASSCFRLRRRRRQLHAAGRQLLRAQGPRRLLHRALRRRLHRHDLHPRPPGPLLRGPLPLGRARTPPRWPPTTSCTRCPIGRHTFRVLSVVWGIGLVVEAGVPHDAGRAAAHRHVPRRVALHHGQRHRQPLCLHRRVLEAAPSSRRCFHAAGTHRCPARCDRPRRPGAAMTIRSPLALTRRR